ncbi:cupin domain-containing protein [Agrobacterium tumefaciens]|uniref:cupin domain-containing protein n=1 Tax=Agrobacterium tumefaciens TaxID=358 RepID=UPI00287CF9E9|nr:cupin domain-containing protein [Agrobacterium tumefaciens]MDS7598489.1 cupin domain-containing protein [Agrobacterium tumefaciens]
MFKAIIAAGVVVSALATPTFAAQKAHNAKVSVVFDQKLPNVPGKSLRGVLVEYGPGGYNPSHTHARSAFIYATVIEGEVKSKINGGEEKIFKTGENWIEMPGDHHQVSANASTTKPAKILAVFVVDTTETELTTPDP